jgi:hypothetical protein
LLFKSVVIVVSLEVLSLLFLMRTSELSVAYKNAKKNINFVVFKIFYILLKHPACFFASEKEKIKSIFILVIYTIQLTNYNTMVDI